MGDLLQRLSAASGKESTGSCQESEYGRAEVSDEAGKEERSAGMRHVFRRKQLVRHEVPGVIQRHDDHDESAQDIHRN
jgi:hypothetical protein